MFSSQCSYAGGEITDTAIVEKLPQSYRNLLQQVNGCILFDGGLHIRGAVVSPRWHSLRVAWFGETALHRLFPAIKQHDIPFGQDCQGDQFVLRDAVVHRLQAETGDVKNLAMDLETFLRFAHEAPVEFLSLQPLQRFRREGGELKPGELLSVYPPFCTKESAAGVSLKAIPASDRIAFLADFAGQLSRLSHGTKVKIKTSK
ncbi:MAG TPA: hypothetical protein VJA94_20705 [Candidatus Angelobacter sp.]